MNDHQEDLDRIAKTKKRAATEDAQRAAVAVSRAAERTGHGPITLHVLLAFEEANPGRSGRKEETIRATFGCSTARYYQQLNAAIDNPTALELNPMLINRLRARRARSTTGRASRPTTHQ